jgi:hypothetical protein
MLKSEPFEAFEVHLSSGDVHRVTHPELAWVAGSEVYVYYPLCMRQASPPMKD